MTMPAFTAESSLSAVTHHYASSWNLIHIPHVIQAVAIKRARSGGSHIPGSVGTTEGGDILHCIDLGCPHVYCRKDDCCFLEGCDEGPDSYSCTYECTGPVPWPSGL